jgi:hypothetical protein
MSRSRGRSRGAALRVIRGGVLLCGLSLLFAGLTWAALSHRSSPAVALAVSGEHPDGTCVPVAVRREMERESCLDRTYRELLDGWLDPEQAMERLRDCAASDPGIAEAARVSALLRLESYRARLALGYVPGMAEAERMARLAEASGVSLAPGARASAARLRSAGLGPFGFEGEASHLARRLRASAPLRRDIAEVFGAETARIVESLVERPEREGATPTALRLGLDVLVPTGYAGDDGDTDVEIVRVDGYDGELIDLLVLLEEMREAYLSRAGAEYRRIGSIASFLDSPLARAPGAAGVGAVGGADRGAAAERALLAELPGEIARRLGPDPTLVYLMEHRVRTALSLSDACRSGAVRRAGRVRAGAGVVAGLVGGAVAVVAAGATGTLAGGVVIAGALQAAGGAYLAHRSELASDPPPADRPTRRPPALPEPESERIDWLARAERYVRGADGALGEERLEPMASGAWGEGEGEEGEGDEISEAREPTATTLAAAIPAELPPVPEEAAALPPMLEALLTSEAPRLTLAEAQARIDEFLALDARRDEARDAVALRDAERDRLVEEATAALELWVGQRTLASDFGEFFLRAEALDVAERSRAGVLARASARWTGDRASYRAARDLTRLREAVAERLVLHCRGEPVRGDLVAQACTDPTALALVTVAAIVEADAEIPAGTILGVQAAGNDFHPVLFDEARREVVSLLDGSIRPGVRAPLYHPAAFYYGFLIESGVRPDPAVEPHLLIAAADPGVEPDTTECVARRPGLVRRVADWIGSIFGRAPDGRRECGAGDGIPARDGATDRRAGGGSGVQVTITRPGIPVPAGGSGPPGGGGGGGGGGGSEGGAAGRAGGGGGDGAGGGSDGGSGRSADGSSAGAGRGGEDGAVAADGSGDGRRSSRRPGW